MKNVASSINGVAGAVVGVIKGLVVAFVFAGIIFALPKGVLNPIDGIVALVNSFLGGGLSGLVALMVFASFMD